MPRYTPLVKSLPATVPFVGTETQERARGRKYKARMGANESVFGPSPKALAAMAEAATHVWKYSMSDSFDLTSGLVKHLGVPSENILVGEGIDGTLGVLVRMLVEKDTPVVTTLGTYPTFNYHVAGYGGKLVTVPYKNDAQDLDALVAAAREHNAALVYVVNPDNPMGSFHSADAIANMIEQLPGDCLLCLDEAYCEFAPQGSLLPLNINDKRIIRMRTFSKIYGMAGARIAYAIAHEELITTFDRVRNHFGVNLIAQAGALAALENEDWTQAVLARTQKAIKRIAGIARDNGLKPLPTATNFVAIDCGQGAEFAKQVVAELGERDVFIRMPFVEPQNRCIRISAGKDEDIDLLAKVLPEALKAAKISS